MAGFFKFFNYLTVICVSGKLSQQKQIPVIVNVKVGIGQLVQISDTNM